MIALQSQRQMGRIDSTLNSIAINLKSEIWFKWKKSAKSGGDEKRDRKKSSLGRGRGAITPAWVTGSNTSSGHYRPGRKSDDSERAYDRVTYDSSNQYVIRVKSCLINDGGLRRMPISSENNLPHIIMPLTRETGKASIKDLYDTGGALNTGSLKQHKFIMDKISAAVAKYEEFNGTNPFDPIKFSGALLDPDDYDAEKHGILSAVITYHTPLKEIISGKSVILSFALGADMSVGTIIGLPFIKQMKLELRFDPDRYLSHVSKKEFEVV